MNISKVGLLAVAMAGVVAFAVTRTSASDTQAAKPAKGATPEKAIPVATGQAKDAPKVLPAAPAAADPHAGHDHGPATPAATPAVPAGPAGKAEIKELSHDAGSVERGVDITHAFTIKNVGQHDLTVDAKPG